MAVAGRWILLRGVTLRLVYHLDQLTGRSRKSQTRMEDSGQTGRPWAPHDKLRGVRGMTHQQRRSLYDEQLTAFDRLCAAELSLDPPRGKPAREQWTP